MSPEVPRTRGPIPTPAQWGVEAPPAPPESWPLNRGRFTEYFINRIYPTIQGEGAQAGTPMTIVRLQGCPVGCVWCDTPETWLPSPQAVQPGGRSGPTWVQAQAIATQVAGLGLTWALVTGGEPTWHELGALTSYLAGARVRRALETSGVFPISGIWDWVCLSPKPAGRLPLLDTATNLRAAHEVKWIVGREDDVGALDMFLDQYAEHWRWDLRVSVQPVSCSERATEVCLRALMRRPGWRLSIQTHKLLGVD